MKVRTEGVSKNSIHVSVSCFNTVFDADGLISVDF